MSATLSNSLQQMNLYADEMTYRMTGDVTMDGSPNIHVSTMVAPGEVPVPAADGAGGMVGRQVQPPVPESGRMPKLKGGERDRGYAAHAAA